MAVKDVTTILRNNIKRLGAIITKARRCGDGYDDIIIRCHQKARSVYIEALNDLVTKEVQEKYEENA